MKSEPGPIDPATVRCPTCRASQPWSDTCRRCRCDLRLLRAMARTFHRKRRLCVAMLGAGQPMPAQEAARRCVALSSDRESRRLLALASFRSGDWATAVVAAREAILP